MFKVSVIIATYNRCAQLAKVLDELLRQETDGSFGFEVLVVDNNSMDKTKAVVEERMHHLKGDCQGPRYIFEPRQGKPYALNCGIREARGEILAFTDDDVSIDPHWLQEIWRCFQETNCDGVGGRVLPVYPQGTPSWVREHPHKISGGVVIYDNGEGTFAYEAGQEPFIGANFAFKKEVFTQCGGFSPEITAGLGVALGEDVELIERALKCNKRLYYCGNAVVYHPVDLKRITLSHAARWSEALGGFCARMEYKNKKNEMVYFAGAPRYLYKGILMDILRFPVAVWSRLGLFDWVRGYNRKKGMIREYWAIQNKNKRLRHV